MAGVRVKSGTILKRVEGLLRASGIPQEDKPRWVDVCAAFPPKCDSVYGRQPPKTIAVREIAYLEDYIKELYFRKIGSEYLLPPVSLDPSDFRGENICKQFVSKYIALIHTGMKDPDEILLKTKQAFQWQSCRDSDSELMRRRNKFTRPVKYKQLSEETLLKELSVIMHQGGTGGDTSRQKNLHLQEDQWQAWKEESDLEGKS